MRRVVEVLRGAHVEVLVEHIGLQAFDGRGGDELQIGIFRLDGFVERRVALLVAAGLVEPVFVADFDIGELEGRGVAVFDALGAPFGVGSAGHVFDLVEGVLDIGLS